MGEVFLAKAGAHGVERFFAIKRILTQHEGSEQFSEMLLHEAKVAITLSHPNIAQVIEFGEIDGHFFLAMEFVQGISVSGLLRHCQKNKVQLPVADAVSVVLQTCRALDYAHNKKDSEGRPLHIVHRDVSPQNILVDETGSVKLIDFGIAKAAMVNAQTEASTIKGKIPYMSPEQARGEPLDQRSDVYSLGVVFFEILATERMYASGNSFDTLRQVAAGEIPDIQATLGERVPAPVLDALTRTLAWNRDERYASAAELEPVLSRLLHELEPGYTSHALATRLSALDAEAEDRRERLKSYSRISASGLFDTALEVSGKSRAWPQTASGREPDVLTTPSAVDALGFDVDDGSMVNTQFPTQALVIGADRSGPAREERDGGLRRALYVAGGACVLLAGGAALFLFGAGAPQNAALAPPSLTAPSLASPAAGNEADDEVMERARGTKAAGSDDAAPRQGAQEAARADPEAAVAETKRSQKKTRPRGADAQPQKRETARASASRKDPGPAAEGCVSIVVEPWAYVVVDGERRGTAPMACLKLPAGKATLVLENPALGAKREVRVVVPAGGTAKVYEKL